MNAKERILKDLWNSEGVSHTFIVDTGSSESIIPYSVLKKLDAAAIVMHSPTRIFGVTGYTLPIRGKTQVHLSDYTKRGYSSEFLVAESMPSIIGQKALKRMHTTLSLLTTGPRVYILPPLLG